MNQAFNPYLPSYEYVPDGEPYVFGERVYIYGSHDRFNGDAFCVNDYVGWSASVHNLADWRYEGVIYRKDQDPRLRDAKSRRMFAPDVQQGPDGRYYLYYAFDFSGTIGVAVCDSPAGAYEYYGCVSYPDGTFLGEGEHDVFHYDPGVLMDADGSVYLYTGFCPSAASRARFCLPRPMADGAMVTELERDMLTIKKQSALIVPDSEHSAGTTFAGHAFFEAASIRRIGSRYYFIYSSEHGHELCYATSESPSGDFIYGGTIISSGDIFYQGRTKPLNYTGTNHGSIVPIDGRWYVFYHRQTNGNPYSRQGCAERIEILPDGSIPQVEVTSCGLNGGPLSGSGRYNAGIACALMSAEGAAAYEVKTQIAENHPYITQDGEDREENPAQYISNLRDGAVAGFRYFEINQRSRIAVRTRGSGAGTLLVLSVEDGDTLASIAVEPSADWTEWAAPLTVAPGVTALWFRYEGRGAIDFESFELRPEVEKWGMAEVAAAGRVDGNPFTDYVVKATFKGAAQTVQVDGFYDGGGIYKARFMPSHEGTYTYELTGNFRDDAVKGSFEVLPPSGANHGPVRVADTYHFRYEDGTPYYSAGTTCYAWTHQSEQRQEETLHELRKGYFNKIRFCIFPKHYIYNLEEPASYPYEGTPVDSAGLNEDNFREYTGKSEGNNWDFTRFNPEHFRRIERCIVQLAELGIEADLILMHPYDRWGFSQMTAAQDDLYINYVTARFSAYRNIWWSLANEYDLMPAKGTKDWERYARIICARDPYEHLRSIHNCIRFYDYRRDWITHCSIQRVDVYKCAEFTDMWQEQYGKPVVLDEIGYEGNVNYGWGNISGAELVRRFWETALRGGYAGHGETYMHPQDILWWSHGGKLHGESHERIKFLYQILAETPGLGLAYKEATLGFSPAFSWDEVTAEPYDSRYKGSYYLTYYSFMRPSFREYHIDDLYEYEVEMIDTWNMTIEKIGTYQGKFRIDLPGRAYIALRIRRVS